MFNSALVYELSALKPLAEPLLRQVHFNTKNMSKQAAAGATGMVLPLGKRKHPG